jgi:urease gamma subunit
MFIHGAINKAKAQEAEKVAISLKVSVDIKRKLQKIADDNNVSLNNLCASILESVLDGELDEHGTMKIVEELTKAKNSLNSIREAIANGENEIHGKDGVLYYMHDEEAIASAKVIALTSELKRRGEK